MKKNTLLITALIIASLAFLNTKSFALVGGPYDNNTFDDFGTQGTYIASLSASNTNGRVTFALADNLESYGALSIFRQGVFYRGSAQGGIDVLSKRVFCAFVGVDITTISTAFFDTGGATSLTTGGSFADLLNETNTLNTFSSPDQFNMTGGFDVKVDKSYPIFRFSGKGDGFFTKVVNARQSAFQVGDDGVVSFPDEVGSSTITTTDAVTNTATVSNGATADQNRDGVISEDAVIALPPDADGNVDTLQVDETQGNPVNGTLTVSSSTARTTDSTSSVERNIDAPAIETTEVKLNVRGYRASTQAAGILFNLEQINRPLYGDVVLNVIPENLEISSNSGNNNNSGGNN